MTPSFFSRKKKEESVREVESAAMKFSLGPHKICRRTMSSEIPSYENRTASHLGLTKADSYGCEPKSFQGEEKSIFSKFYHRFKRPSRECEKYDHGSFDSAVNGSPTAVNDPAKRHSVGSGPVGIKGSLLGRRNVPGPMHLPNASISPPSSIRYRPSKPESTPVPRSPPTVPERSPASLGVVPQSSSPGPHSDSPKMGKIAEEDKGNPLSPALGGERRISYARAFKPLPPLPTAFVEHVAVQENNEAIVHCEKENDEQPPDELAPAPPVELLYRPKDETFPVTAELHSLSKCGWYWGPISRSEAEKRLDDQPDGAFLVRNSLDRRYLLSLSFRSLQQTLHARIEYENGSFSFYPQIEEEVYPSVVELIASAMKKATVCYSRSRHPDSPTFPVRLTHPVTRFAEVSSLKYLCRFTIRLHIRADYLEQTRLPESIRKFLLSCPVEC